MHVAATVQDVASSDAACWWEPLVARPSMEHPPPLGPEQNVLNILEEEAFVDFDLFEDDNMSILGASAQSLPDVTSEAAAAAVPNPAQ